MSIINAYFVSDLHLLPHDEFKNSQFLGWLKELEKQNTCTHLFLLGDIFDLWIADHSYFQECFKDIILQICRLRDLGVEIHYFEGNHDLYLESIWAEQLKVVVHSDPIYFNLAGLILRLEHGDQMDPSDRGYIFLRWFLRTRFLIWLAHSLPGSWVAQIGRRASQKSRRYTSQIKQQNEESAKQKMREHAERVFKDRPFDILIAGHMHVREDKVLHLKEKSFRVVNLGYWEKSPCALQLIHDGKKEYQLHWHQWA